MFKKRREKKLQNYKEKLASNNFNNGEISKVVPIYLKILRMSNIFLANILLFVISLIILIVSQYIKVDLKKDLLLKIFASISSVFAIISSILSLVVFVKVVVCPINEMRKKALIWAILSIVPILSFIAFFIMKWKVSHLYKYRKLSN